MTTEAGGAVVLKPCPFFGCDAARPEADENQGGKWGAIRCCGCGVTGPEVRTGYDLADDAPWHARAAEEWNTRPIEAAERAAREAAEARATKAERDRDEWRQIAMLGKKTIDAAALAIAEGESALAAMRAQCEGLATELRWIRARWHDEKRPLATLVGARGSEVCDWMDRTDALLRALASGSAGGEANSG